MSADHPAKSKYQIEFDALPEWARNLVLAAQARAGHGLVPPPGIDKNHKHSAFFIWTDDDTAWHRWNDGSAGLYRLADALTAPWPPPSPPPQEHRDDQPCCFGINYIEDGVFCHNYAWPAKPDRCRRNRTDYKHEDCPGFVANPDAASA